MAEKLWVIVLAGQCLMLMMTNPAEAAATSCGTGVDLCSKMESLEEQVVQQQKEIIKLNQQIIGNLDKTLNQLSSKLSHLESGNTYRFERMKTELNKQNKQIADLVQRQNPPATNLDDQFAQQNQLLEQRLAKLEEAVGQRIDQLTEEKWTGKIGQECDALKESLGNMFSKLEQTHERSQENFTSGSELMVSGQNHLNGTIHEVVIPKLSQLSDQLTKLESDNKVCIEKTVNETLSGNTAKGSNDTESQNLNSHFMRSCSDTRIKSSGRYMIQPFKGEDAFEAYCEHEKFGGGWHVIQYRFDGSVDFYRGWEEYKKGFGDLKGEFFVGLQIIHRLTTTKKHLLMVEVENFKGKYGYAQYDNFKFGNENELFKLKEVGRYSGTAGDSLKWDKGMKFTTKDRDHDDWSEGNYATHLKGAWWYGFHGRINLNGPYVKEGGEQSNYWPTLNNNHESMKMTRMMIKEA